jgi:sigma-B regulation protein RsbU (phosphoserine phosphatase)
LEVPLLQAAFPSELEHVRQDLPCGRICDDQIREAKIIQSSLLPKTALRDQSVEFALRFIPFSEVGGDFADFFRLPDGRIGIYLGDVVGKGLPAAMFATLVMGTLRGIHKTGSDSADVLTRLNERLVQRPIPGRFCSTLYAVFDPKTLQLDLSNAGMPLPLLVSGHSCCSLGEGGLPSGMFSGSTYENHRVQLDHGDCILFASDGLHELRDPSGEEFCTAEMDEAWAECRGKSAAESADLLFSRQHVFSGGGKPHDDITAIVMKVLS